MKAIIWTKKQCVNCADIKDLLINKLGKDNVESRDSEGLTNGDEFNPKAVKHFAAQRFVVPLVQIGDTFVKFDEVKEYLEKNA